VIAATFAAYILGSLTQFVVESFARWRNSRRGGPQYDLTDTGPIGTYIDQLILDNPHLLVVFKRDPGRDVLSDSEAMTKMAADILHDLPRIGRRMRGDHNELYDEYDRLIGEAQFREVTVVPLFMLIVALTIFWSPDAHWSPYSLLILLAGIALPVMKRQAVTQRTEGNTVVIDAVLVGKVTAPSLERLDRLAGR
jgi:hypothetical protein